MIGRLKISAKIALTNAVLLVLLLTVGATSVINLRETLGKFEDFSQLTDTANAAGSIQADMLAIEISVRDYILAPNEENEALVRTRIGGLTENLTGIRESMTDQALAAKFDTLSESLATYSSVFDNVTAREAEREKLISVDLSSVGDQTLDTVFTLASKVSLDGDADMTLWAAEMYQLFAQVRFLVQSFLNNNDEKSFEQAQKRIASFEKGFGKLSSKLTEKKFKASIKKTNRFLGGYKEALGKVRDVIAARNVLVNTDLKASSDAVSSVVAELKADILTVQSDLGDQAAANVNTATQIAIIVSLISAAMALLLAYLLARGIARPIVSMTECMTSLADGDTSQEVPAKERGDEIGSMAQAVQIFRDNALRMQDLENQRERAREQAEQEKKRLMTKMADDFEANVGGIVGAVSGRSTEMHDTARSLSEIAQQTSGRATTVASTASTASSNTQAVASAAEELSASIQEISGQVAQSATISDRAVSNAADTTRLVEGLEKTAEKVGSVVQLITDIAEQTNLLALNATIEAARAGEAGKGFAVVANEVKSLANQTGKATEEITSQIGAMQSATGEVVSSIREISDSIGQMNSISSTIAAAVEEQGAATQEIARNVQEVSAGTHEVSEIIGEVSDAAGRSGDAAVMALGAAEELSSQAENLQREMGSFLQQIRGN